MKTLTKIKHCICLPACHLPINKHQRTVILIVLFIVIIIIDSVLLIT